MLPPLPTGSETHSGVPPSCSSTSNAAVFWPSRRCGLTEFRSASGRRSTSSRTSRSASSKSPCTATTRAPQIWAWASFPRAIAPSGRTTARRIPARPQYAAADADVLPVDAQTAAVAPSSSAFDTATVIPRSLNDPVGLAPSYFR